MLWAEKALLLGFLAQLVMKLKVTEIKGLLGLWGPNLVHFGRD